MPKSGFNACVAFFLLPVEIAFRWFMRNLRELPLARSKYHGEVTFHCLGSWFLRFSQMKWQSFGVQGKFANAMAKSAFNACVDLFLVPRV